MVTKPKISSLLRSILCIPQKSPLTLLEHVICVFEIGVGLVLVFVGFGLFQICLCFSFSPYSKDHAFHRSMPLEAQRPDQTGPSNTISNQKEVVTGYGEIYNMRKMLGRL